MPAGPIVDLTQFANFLKVRAIPKSEKQYLVAGFLGENVERKTANIPLGGRTIEINLETKGVASYGFQDELEPISEPDTIGGQLATVPLSTATARFQISQQAHYSSQGNERAWVGATARHMSSLVEMFQMNQSRMMYGEGTGVLARIKDVGSFPVIELEPDQGASAGRTFGPKYMVKGLRISVNSTKTATKTLDRAVDWRVIAVNQATNKITVDGTLVLDAVAGDYIYLGSKQRPSKGRVLTGVMAYIDDGTNTPSVLGINRTTSGNEFFQAELATAVGGADLENMIQTRIDNIAKTVGGRTNLMLMSLGVWRRFLNDLKGDRRFVSAAETGVYRAGGKALMYSGADSEDIPITRERDTPTGCIFGFDWSTWMMGELQSAGWLQEHDDKSIFRWVPDGLAYQAIYVWMGQLICTKPGANWLASGITEN